MKTPLSKVVPSGQSPEEQEALRGKGWREHGLLIVSPEDPRLNWVQEQVIRQLGARLYGDFNKKGDET